MFWIMVRVNDFHTDPVNNVHADDDDFEDGYFGKTLKLIQNWWWFWRWLFWQDLKAYSKLMMLLKMVIDKTEKLIINDFEHHGYWQDLKADSKLMMILMMDIMAKP